MYAKNIWKEANDEKFDKIMKQAVKICKKIEPDCKIIF